MKFDKRISKFLAKSLLVSAGISCFGFSYVSAMETVKDNEEYVLSRILNTDYNHFLKSLKGPITEQTRNQIKNLFCGKETLKFATESVILNKIEDSASDIPGMCSFRPLDIYNYVVTGDDFKKDIIDFLDNKYHLVRTSDGETFAKYKRYVPYAKNILNNPISLEYLKGIAVDKFKELK